VSNEPCGIGPEVPCFASSSELSGSALNQTNNVIIIIVRMCLSLSHNYDYTLVVVQCIYCLCWCVFCVLCSLSNRPYWMSIGSRRHILHYTRMNLNSVCLIGILRRIPRYTRNTLNLNSVCSICILRRIPRYTRNTLNLNSVCSICILRRIPRYTRNMLNLNSVCLISIPHLPLYRAIVHCWWVVNVCLNLKW
jgi:hypothetical protein